MIIFENSSQFNMQMYFSLRENISHLTCKRQTVLTSFFSMPSKVSNRVYVFLT